MKTIIVHWNAAEKHIRPTKYTGNIEIQDNVLVLEGKQSTLFIPLTSILYFEIVNEKEEKECV